MVACYGVLMLLHYGPLGEKDTRGNKNENSIRWESPKNHVRHATFISSRQVM